MMRLELNDMEEKVLADTLESGLSRLGDEISDTDVRDYREFSRIARPSSVPMAYDAFVESVCGLRIMDLVVEGDNLV